MRTASVPRRENASRSAKPKGGYQLIPAVHLALAWWAYREKLIRLVDLIGSPASRQVSERDQPARARALLVARGASSGARSKRGAALTQTSAFAQ